LFASKQASKPTPTSRRLPLTHTDSSTTTQPRLEYLDLALTRDMSPGAELSPILEAKKRPPPITIPAQPPSRLVTGPSILAITERTEREEAERQAGNAFYQQAKRSASSTPKLSPVDGSHLPLPLRTGSHATKDRQRISGMSTFTQFIDHARSGMSPRKSEVSGHTSSTMSRHSSTARSRHSEHSNRVGRSTHQPEDNGMTSRADIEGRAEKKLFKIMGQVPSTPTSGMWTDQ